MVDKSVLLLFNEVNWLSVIKSSISRIIIYTIFFKVFDMIYIGFLYKLYPCEFLKFVIYPKGKDQTLKTNLNKN